jgi:hypothetical protein
LAPSYDSIKEEYLNDDKFVKEIEAMMPENAMVAQLPYAPYPQYPPVYKMTEYSHFKGYLHSDKLHWSYGAMEGREGDRWYGLVAGMPLEEMAVALSWKGFKGIYVDSFGYPDNGAKLISNISRILKVDPLVSDNNRLYFFDMREYASKINNTLSARLKPSVVLDSGFHSPESWSGVPTRWMQSKAALKAFSFENCTANLSLRAMSFYRPRTLEIYVGGDLAGRVAVPSSSFTDINVQVRLAKGESVLDLQVPEGCERPCDIIELKEPDSRCMSIAVQSITVS